MSTSIPRTLELEDQIARMAAEGVRQQMQILGLDGPSTKRIAMHFDDVVQAMGTKIAEISCGPATTMNDHQRARALMGENFLGIENVINHYGVSYSREQLAVLATIPFSESTLKTCRDTHVLVAGFPLTILEIRAAITKTQTRFASCEDAWYKNQVFATNERVGLRWHLIRKDVLANSTSKSFDKQRMLLSDIEEVPRACEFVYAILLYFLANGARLFENVYARCIDVGVGGRRVDAGHFGPQGIEIYNHYDASAYNVIGIASSLKLTLTTSNNGG